MSIDKRPMIDVALLASRISYSEDAYVIGPFASRVSFGSQQRRALNLAAAIKNDFEARGYKEGLGQKKVAVVGAGIAGLTVALGLLSFNSKVWVFEKDEILFKNMLGASHRDIHPNVNFWPLEDIETTTNLPFLNWYENSCENVLRMIKRQWDKFAEATDLYGIAFGHTVKSIRRQDSKWHLEVDIAVEDAGYTPSERDFDVVIFATGFGIEKYVDGSGSPSYWDYSEDRIGGIQKAGLDPCENFVVSGTGDGGIIEVLRLLFLNFRAGSIQSFSKNSLSNDKMLSNKNLAIAIREIENKVRKLMEDALLHEETPLSEDRHDDISEFIWKRYENFINEDGIADNIQKNLRASRSSRRNVVLLGKRKYPLDHALSPYHKILLTWLIKEGCIDYYKVVDGLTSASDSDIKIKGSKLKIKDVKFSPISKLVYSETGDSVAELKTFKKLEIETLDGCYFLSRHGYTTPLEKLLVDLDPNICFHVRKRQQLYADHDWLTSEQADQFCTGLDINPPSDCALWAHDYAEYAEEYYQRIKEIISIPHKLFVASDRDKTVEFRVRAENERDIVDLKSQLKKVELPNTLFGVPLNCKDVDYIRENRTSAGGL